MTLKPCREGYFMTLEDMKTLLITINEVQDWSLQLLRFNNSQAGITTYFSRRITLDPVGKLTEFVSRISYLYTDQQKGKLNEYKEIEAYNGTIDSQIIYTIPIISDLVRDEYTSLTNAIASPDNEVNPLELRANAHLLNGNIITTRNGDEIIKPIKLISMQSPITMLKNKFLSSNGTFKEIQDKVLNLKPVFDVLIYDDVIYMFTLAGEKLFNMERAYKSVCVKKVDEVLECDFITDIEIFRNTATTGHNPRRFISFNQSRLQQLKNDDKRRDLAIKFSIPLNDNKIDTERSGASEKLIKLLCNKGMVDPFEDLPVEVSSAKSWS